MAVLIGTLALALFNASKDDISRYFAYAYAVISVGILVRVSHPSGMLVITSSLQVYGYAVYQHRITLIRKRDPGSFGNCSSAPFISATSPLYASSCCRPDTGPCRDQHSTLHRRPSQFCYQGYVVSYLLATMHILTM